MVRSSHSHRRIVPMARDGWRFVIPLSAVVLICLVFQFWWTALVFFLLTPAVGAFFRDPARRVPRDPVLILSPADGKVVCIDEVEVDPGDGRPVRLRRVGIVMSIFNAHIQRAPTYGTVVSVAYNPGKFLNAFNDKSSEENEHNMIWIRSESGPIGVKQIAGIIARRVVCWCAPQEHLVVGQRIGLIRFGSRVEAFFPLEAEVCAHVGEKVKAGLSVLARFAGEAHAREPHQPQGEAPTPSPEREARNG